MNETFISYSRKDSEFVSQLLTQLKKASIDPWFDLEDLRPATDWKKEILIAIQACQNFVFVISPNSVSSPYCEYELNHALLHNKRLIPIVWRRVDVESMHPALAEINWIFFDEDFSTGISNLLACLDSSFSSSPGERKNSRLDIITTGQETKMFFLCRNRYVLGRNPTVNIAQSGLIFINDQFVSRTHLTLERKNEQWTVLDGVMSFENGRPINYTKSRNGVKVNGIMLKPLHLSPLRHGDEIQISSCTRLVYKEVLNELCSATVKTWDTLTDLDSNAPSY